MIDSNAGHVVSLASFSAHLAKMIELLRRRQILVQKSKEATRIQESGLPILHLQVAREDGVAV